MPSSPAFTDSREVFKKWVWILNVWVGTRDGYSFPHLWQLLLFIATAFPTITSLFSVTSALSLPPESPDGTAEVDLESTADFPG